MMALWSRQDAVFNIKEIRNASTVHYTCRAHYTPTETAVTALDCARLTMQACNGRQVGFAQAPAMVSYRHAIPLIVVDGVW